MWRLIGSGYNDLVKDVTQKYSDIKHWRVTFCFFSQEERLEKQIRIFLEDKFFPLNIPSNEKQILQVRPSYTEDYALRIIYA